MQPEGPPGISGLGPVLGRAICSAVEPQDAAAGSAVDGRAQ